MKSLIYKKNKGIFLEEKNLPKIENSTDAIIKVKMSSICTSDIHIINGFVPQANDGIVLGHEFVGEIIDIGEDIKHLKIGDRVSANCETFCGECFYCKRGYINNCIVGGWKLGCIIDGCQAEYVRVPFAQNGLNKIPDNIEYKDALFVGDILSSGYFGAELCEIQKDDTVAVIGCGPVGLCAMKCAKLLGAGKIIALDINENRLKIAEEQSCADIFINPLKEDYNQIIKANTSNRGADGVIECAGTNESFRMAWEIARPNSIVALVAMYEKTQQLPLPQMYGKNLTFKTGGVNAIHCQKLLQLISEGKLNTNFLISKEINLSEIISGYRYFQEHKNDCLKIAVLHD